MENSLYFPHFHHLTTHTTTCSCRSWKRKTHFTFHTFITLQHTPLLVHVDPGKGKLTLLSTLSSPYNTCTPLLVHVDPGNGKLTLFSTLSSPYNTRPLLVHVDPGNGKLTLLSTLSSPLQHTPLLVHVDPGNGKITLFSTLSSPYNTRHYLFM